MSKLRKCNICGEVKPLTDTHFYKHPTSIGGFERRCRVCHADNKVLTYNVGSRVSKLRKSIYYRDKRIARLEKTNIELANRIDRLEKANIRLNQRLERLNQQLEQQQFRPDSWQGIKCSAAANEAEVYVANLIKGKLMVGLPFDILTSKSQRIEVKSTRGNGGINLQPERSYDWLVVVRRNELFLLTKGDALRLGQRYIGKGLTTLYPFKTTPDQLVERINKCQNIIDQEEKVIETIKRDTVMKSERRKG